MSLHTLLLGGNRDHCTNYLLLLQPEIITTPRASSVLTYMLRNADMREKESEAEENY